MSQSTVRLYAFQKFEKVKFTIIFRFVSESYLLSNIIKTEVKEREL